MKIEYDRQVDALYIELAGAKVARTEEAGDAIHLDFDADGRLIGVEILDASKHYAKVDLGTVIARNLLDTDSETAA
jgi:YD repeat-containing protein